MQNLELAIHMLHFVLEILLYIDSLIFNLQILKNYYVDTKCWTVNDQLKTSLRGHTSPTRSGSNKFDLLKFYFGFIQ